MKTKMQIILWAIIILMTGIVSKSQTPPILPIQSQDALRNYALASVTHGSRWVNAESMDWNYPGKISNAEVTGNGAEAVLDKLFGVEFVYRLTNQKDEINGGVALYDNSNNLVFYGQAKYTAASLAKEKPQYNIWMQEISLLDLDNVQSAEVLALDEDGVTARRYQLQVEQGHPRFQPYMSGAPNGLLAVRFNNGTVVTYQLANPVGQVPETETDGSSSWKIEGHYVLKTGADPEPRVVIVEPWIRPTVLLTVTTFSERIITFDVSGLVQMDGKTSFERPSAIVVTQVNGPFSGKIITSSDKPVDVAFKNGTYRVLFEWKSFGQPNTLYTGPESPSPVSGGGKG